MEDNNLKPEENSDEKKPEIIVNEYGGTKESAVVVDEENRTVLLTEDETIVIEKEKTFNVPPKNRARKVYAGMWGIPEIAAVGASLLAVLAMILLFVFLVLPAQKQLNDNRAKRDELDKQLLTARSRYGNFTTTKEGVEALVRSVDDFETRYLSASANGQAALYQQINGLISAYDLTNTSGPDYAPLEIADANRNNQQSENEKGRSKLISIYPGMYVTMTLDGSYQNLRRFIREIETSNQFVVISSIELEPSENKEKQGSEPENTTQAVINNQSVNPSGVNPVGANPSLPRPNPTAQPAAKIDRGKMRGETVTLRLEMAAYFRRQNFQPQTASVER